MKQVGFSPGQFFSSVPAIGEPLLQPGRASDVSILTGPMFHVQQEADWHQRQHVFSLPRIALWERELASSNIPSSQDRARVIILSGQDMLSFCRQHNNGNLPLEPQPMPQRHFIGKLLDWVLPHRKRARQQRGLQGNMQRRDAMVENIKQYAASAKGLSRLPVLSSPQAGAEFMGKLTYITVD